MAYAILESGGRQYRVSVGDKFDVEKVDLEVGDMAAISDVLLYSDGTSTKVGTPFISGATVTVEVVAQHRAPKVTAFKFKRRKGFHKTKGHRQPLTRLVVKSIEA